MYYHTGQWGTTLSFDPSEFSARSYSSSRSYSSTGLMPEFRPYAFRSFAGLSSKLTGLLNLIPTSNPVKQWADLMRPVFQNNVRRAVASLANRGILDSSVTKGLLGRIYSSYLNELQRRAITYPLLAIGTLGKLGASYGTLGRTGSTTTVSQSYYINPSPAIGLLTSLIGL